MPRSKAPEQPLIVRLKEISATLRRIAKTDRMIRRESKKVSPKDRAAFIDAFYEGAIQSGTLAARLIDQALQLHGKELRR